MDNKTNKKREATLPSDWFLVRAITGSVKTDEKLSEEVYDQISVYAGKTEQEAIKNLLNHFDNKNEVTLGITRFNNFLQLHSHPQIIKDDTGGNIGHYLIKAIKAKELSNLFSRHKKYKKTNKQINKKRSSSKG